MLGLGWGKEADISVLGHPSSTIAEHSSKKPHQKVCIFQEMVWLVAWFDVAIGAWGYLICDWKPNGGRASIS